MSRTRASPLVLTVACLVGLSYVSAASEGENDIDTDDTSVVWHSQGESAKKTGGRGWFEQRKKTSAC
ncbi:MAG TPA: hypothetical protein VMY06_05630 [Sedimentisphaerales bacterium]|nr:hypothetical protein [Sedimentisphaerales bacterium]